MLLETATQKTNRKRKSCGNKKTKQEGKALCDPLNFEKVMSDLHTQSISGQLPKDPPLGTQ
jgi:hypothetical protein